MTRKSVKAAQSNDTGPEKFPAPAYTENVLRENFEEAKRLFLDALIEVDSAHAVMLKEQGIITSQEADSIFRALRELDREKIRQQPYDGQHEDLFFYLQSLITESCGPDVAGRLHTARSRNDIDVTIYRMRLRTEALRVGRAMLDLTGVLLDTAERHRETVIPAYTHTQPAQPTTLAHFLLAMAEVLGRDFERLRRAVDGLNRCPLGACAITTTGFPINRERTAELLGFEAPTINSYASIAAVDYFTELMASLSVTLVNIGRFSQEFLLMAMREFNAIRLSDGFVQTSSIMPQKRNPVALEHVRALASKALGQASAVFLSVHNTPFGDINDVEDDLQPLLDNVLTDARRAISLLAASLSTATFDVDTLRRRAEGDFISVTELADELVRRAELPFRTAHEIVAKSVAAALEAGSEINREILQNAARQVLNDELEITEDELKMTLDPDHFVRVRRILGGPAPEETLRASEVERRKQHEHEAWYQKKIQLLNNYQHALEAALAENIRR